MGGLNMLDVKKFITSLKSTWLMRLLSKRSKYFDFLNTTYPFVSNISCFGGDFIKRKLHLVNNTFSMEVFDSYILLDEQITIKKDNSLTLPLWHTRIFRIAGNSVFYKYFYEGGILFVNALLNEKGYFRSFDSFIQKWNVGTNFLQFNSLLKCVKIILAANNIENHNVVAHYYITEGSNNKIMVFYIWLKIKTNYYICFHLRICLIP